MPRIAAASRSYLAVADAAGVMRDLSPWLESVSPLGKVVGWLDATGLNDVAGRTMSATETAQEFAVSGRWDDAPESSPDAVLSSIVGRPVAVQYGPAGNAPGSTPGGGKVRLPVVPNLQPVGTSGAVRGAVPAGWPGHFGGVVDGGLSLPPLPPG